MSCRLDWQHLRWQCGRPLGELQLFDASQLCLDFGGLARWCLRPEVLSLAATDDSVPEVIRGAWRAPASVPAAYGAGWVVFGTDDPEEVPLMRPAFVLPLRWVQSAAEGSSPSADTGGAEHEAGKELRHGDRETLPGEMLPGEMLPGELTALRDRVLDELSGSPQVGAKRWTLRLAGELGTPDLRRFDLACESGWASLAAGLLVAAEGGTPDERVFATGCWSKGAGIRPVGEEHLAAKLTVAVELGATHFFVPDSQASRARALVHKRCAGPLEIGSLYESTPDPRRALRDYLRHFDLPPDRGASRDSRRRYYLRQGDEAWAKEYYRQNLLPEIIEHCRSQLYAAGWTDRPTHLVTIASDNSELVPLGIEVLRPARCLVVYTEDYAAKTALTRGMARNNTVGCEVHERGFADLDALREGMREAIEEFLTGSDAERVVFDLTPGPKDVSFSWMLELAAPKNRLYYLRHRRQGFKVDPFSEQPQIWIAGKGWGGRR